MAKDKTIYTCNACGGTSPRWLGKCPHCGAWNTLVETVAEAARRQEPPEPAPGLCRSGQCPAGDAAVGHRGQDVARTPSGIEELDRVLGGGMVEGGVVLIGGDPGIGKSTLLLQAMDALQRAACPRCM
jgi:DNA repair protein RadA/Sms